MRTFFSTEGVFKTRNLALIALMAALKIILEPFSIYLTPQFKLITFSYLPGTVVAALFGPWAALIFGFISDTLGYFIKPMGPYFPGYAISEMVTYFVYACLLYKQKITVTRVLIARIITIATVIFGLNYIWNVMLYGTVAGGYFTGARLINNLVQVPAHVALTYGFCRFARQMESRAQRGSV